MNPCMDKDKDDTFSLYSRLGCLDNKACWLAMAPGELSTYTGTMVKKKPPKFIVFKFNISQV